jgi:Flp pilus assembly protein TadB
MSGAILIALPLGIAMMLRVINREYFDLLLTTGLGNILLYCAAAQQGIGIYWMKKLLDFDN